MLTETLQVVAATVKRFAIGRSLKLTQTGHSVEVTPGTASAQTSLSVTKFEDATNFIAYRVEERGSGELVVSADGADIWRGAHADDTLERAVTLAAARTFLDSQENH